MRVSCLIFYERLFVVGDDPEKVLTQMEGFSPPMGPMAGPSTKDI